MKFEDMINTIQLGDSYELMKQIPDKSIDCIYTDIPYLFDKHGMGNGELADRLAKRQMELMGLKRVYEENNTTKKEALRIAKNIKKTSLNVISLEDGIDYKIFDEFVRVMKKTNCYIWCSKHQILGILKYFVEEKGCNFEILTWCKTNPTPSTNNKFLPDIEYCLYFREKGVSLNDNYELKSKFYVSSANVKDKKEFIHPTIKPLDFVSRHIEHTTQPNDIVLDPFVGSGTTCVASKELGRRYIGIEINKEYYEIAKNRLNGINAMGQTSIFTNFEMLKEEYDKKSTN